MWGRAVVVDVSDRDRKTGDLLDVDALMGVAADSGAQSRARARGSCAGGGPPRVARRRRDPVRPHTAAPADRVGEARPRAA
jgi:hypothetical protein